MLDRLSARQKAWREISDERGGRRKYIVCIYRRSNDPRFVVINDAPRPCILASYFPSQHFAFHARREREKHFRPRPPQWGFYYHTRILQLSNADGGGGETPRASQSLSYIQASDRRRRNGIPGRTLISMVLLGTSRSLHPSNFFASGVHTFFR